MTGPEREGDKEKQNKLGVFSSARRMRDLRKRRGKTFMTSYGRKI